MQYTIDFFTEKISHLKGATFYYRTDWDVWYFGLGSKMFGFITKDLRLLTIKNTPEKNERLREAFPESIIPGYHMNKTHWNSVLLVEPTIDEVLLTTLLQESYQLVFQKLSQKEQACIQQV